MAWIAVILPSPRYPHERYQVRFQHGSRRRSAAIFTAKRRAFAEKQALERGNREPLPEVVDLTSTRERRACPLGNT